MGGLSDFDVWYQEQHPRVLGALTVASGSVDIAAEATDEAFVRAYERWERVRRMASPGGWLYRVALNYVRRRFRRQTIERELLRRRPADSTEAPEQGPEALDPHLWAAVRSLPTRQRTAVALRYVLDLPEAEVARLMGVSRGSASASLTAARRRLEGLLADPAPAPTTPEAGVETRTGAHDAGEAGTETRPAPDATGDDHSRGLGRPRPRAVRRG